MLLAAGELPPKRVQVHGWLLVGGEKMSKTRLNQIAPGDLVADFGVDGFRYHFLREVIFGNDGDFSYEGMVARYNSDLANNFGNLLSRVATVVEQKCGGVGPAPRARQPAGRGRRRGLRRHRRGLGRACSRRSRSTPPGGSSARPTPTSRPTSRGRPSPAPPSTRCSATPSRHSGSWPCWRRRPSRPPAAEVWRRIGLPGAPTDERLPGRRDLGRLPRRPPRREGRPALPPHQGRLTVVAAPDVPADVRWTDNHCHLPAGAEAEERPSTEARSAGVDRFVTVGTDAEHSARPSPWPPRTTPCGPPSGCTPTTPRTAPTPSSACSTEPGVVAVGECGLDYHYDHSPRDVQRVAFAAQVELARRHDLALVIHTREAWDDTFDVLEAVGVPERTVFHCFTGGPVEARRALGLGAWLSFSGIVTFKSADDVRAAAALCPLDRLLVETDSPYLAPVPHRGRPNRPALVTLVGAAIAEVKGVAVDAVAAASWHAADEPVPLVGCPADLAALNAVDLPWNGASRVGRVDDVERNRAGAFGLVIAPFSSRSRYGSCDRVTGVPKLCPSPVLGSREDTAWTNSWRPADGSGSVHHGGGLRPADRGRPSLPSPSSKACRSPRPAPTRRSRPTELAVGRPTSPTSRRRPLARRRPRRPDDHHRRHRVRPRPPPTGPVGTTTTHRPPTPPPPGRPEAGPRRRHQGPTPTMAPDGRLPGLRPQPRVARQLHDGVVERELPGRLPVQPAGLGRHRSARRPPRSRRPARQPGLARRPGRPGPRPLPVAGVRPLGRGLRLDGSDDPAGDRARPDPGDPHPPPGHRPARAARAQPESGAGPELRGRPEHGAPHRPPGRGRTR